MGLVEDCRYLSTANTEAYAMSPSSPLRAIPIEATWEPQMTLLVALKRRGYESALIYSTPFYHLL
jgi:hypothetical protein